MPLTNASESTQASLKPRANAVTSVIELSFDMLFLSVSKASILRSGGEYHLTIRLCI